MPVCGKDHAPNNTIERDGNSKKSHPALDALSARAALPARAQLPEACGLRALVRDLQREAAGMLAERAARTAPFVVPQQRLVPMLGHVPVLPARHEMQRRVDTDAVVEINEREHALDRLADDRVEKQENAQD